AGAATRLAQTLGEGAREPEWRPLLAAWLEPAARVGFAQAIDDGVTAAIDLSDGLAGDLMRLCEASGVGAVLDEAAFADDAWLAGGARGLGVDVRTLALGPSDDYELMLAIDPAAREAVHVAAHQAGVPLTLIGRLTDSPGVLGLRDAKGAVRALAATG